MRLLERQEIQRVQRAAGLPLSLPARPLGFVAAFYLFDAGNGSEFLPPGAGRFLSDFRAATARALAKDEKPNLESLVGPLLIARLRQVATDQFGNPRPALSRYSVVFSIVGPIACQVQFEQ